MTLDPRIAELLRRQADTIHVPPPTVTAAQIRERAEREMAARRQRRWTYRLQQAIRRLFR